MFSEIERLKLLEAMVSNFRHNQPIRRDFEYLLELLLKEFKTLEEHKDNSEYLSELRLVLNYSDDCKEAFDSQRKVMLEYFIFNRKFKEAISKQISRLLEEKS